MEVKMKAKKASVLWPKIRTPFFWAIAMAVLLWCDVPGKLVSLVETLDISGMSSGVQSVVMALPAFLGPVLSIVFWVILLSCGFNILWKIGLRAATGLKNSCGIPKQATLWLARLLLIWLGLVVLESVLDNTFGEVSLFLTEWLGDATCSWILAILFPVVSLLFCAILIYLVVLLLVVLFRLIQKAVQVAHEKGLQKKSERQAKKAQKEEEKQNKPVHAKAGKSGMLDQRAQAADAALKTYRNTVEAEHCADYLWIKQLGVNAKDEIFLWDRKELYITLERFELTLRKENGRAWLLGEERVELFPNAPCVGYVEIGEREFRQLILTYIKGA